MIPSSAPNRPLDGSGSGRGVAVLRPVVAEDGAALWDLLRRGEADVTGMSSLPTSAIEAEQRCHAVAATVATLDAGAPTTVGPGSSAPLLLVLEGENGSLLGLTGCTIKDEVVNYSVEIGTSATGRGLSVVGRERAWTATELNATYLAPEARGQGLGSLLSRGRLAFLVPVAAHVPGLLVSHLRGPMGTGPSAPFWTRFGRDVLPQWSTSVTAEAGLIEDPERLGELTGHSLAVDPSLLDVVGSVHRLSLPAYRILQAEGFVSNGMYDPVDAGPTVTCDLVATSTWRRHRRCRVDASERFDDPDGPAEAVDGIVTNGAVTGFRACRATVGSPRRSRANAEGDGDPDAGHGVDSGKQGSGEGPGGHPMVTLGADTRRSLAVATGRQVIVVPAEARCDDEGSGA